MSVQFNVTDNYTAQIKAVLEGVNNSEFPLLDRVSVVSGNVSELLQVTGLETGVMSGSSGTKILEKDIVSKVPQGILFDMEIEGTNRVTADVIQSAVKRIQYVLMRTLEAHLLFGQTNVKGFENSPVRGALFYAATHEYSQGTEDVMFVKENDFTPIQAGMEKVESSYYNNLFGEIAGAATAKGFVINPNRALLVGNITPEIAVYKDLRSNRVKVVGSVQVAGGFDSSSAIKYI